MKVTRRQLKNIIKEFLDTSVKPTTQATSTYDQATNSERAAFISAMGIAEKASKSGKINSTLSEGPVYPFRPSPGQSPEQLSPVYDEDGDITPKELNDYDLDGEVEDQADAYAAEFDKGDEDYLPPELKGVKVSLPAGMVLPFSRKGR